MYKILNHVSKTFQCKTLCSITARRRKSKLRKFNAIEMVYKLYKSVEHKIELPPVIMLHGSLGSKENWGGAAQAIANRTKRLVYAMDARNHGKSPHTKEHNSVLMAADVHYFMLTHDLSKICVLGHGIGGRAMMYLALDQPNLVESGIIIDVTPYSMPYVYLDADELYSIMLSISIPPNLSLDEGKRLVAANLGRLVTEPFAILQILENLRRNEKGEFSWVPNLVTLRENAKWFGQYEGKLLKKKPFNGPMLFIGGRNSTYMHPNDLNRIKKYFPNARVDWLPTNHLPHYEDPKGFTILCSKFFIPR